MKARALVLAASLLAAVGLSPLTVRAAPIDWVLATMTVTQQAVHQIGGSFSLGDGSGDAPGEPPPSPEARPVGGPSEKPPQLEIVIAGHEIGDHPTVLGSAVSFDGHGFSDVFDTAGGGFHVQTTKDLGSIDIQLTDKKNGGFGFGAGGAAFGSIHTITMLAFIVNGTINSYHVEGVGGTPLVFTGSGSRAIGAADPDSSGVAVDASIVAAGASTFDLNSAVGLVGGPATFECTHCTVSWKTPTGDTGQMDQQTLPFIFLPVPIPVPPPPVPLDSMSGDDGFFGPAGNWSWSWTGVNVRPDMSETIAAAYAPVGDLWKLFVPSAAPIVVTPKPATKPSSHKTEVLGSKHTRKALAATGVSSMPMGWLFFGVAFGLAAILRRRPLRASD